jgi:hypothetical protein
VSSSGESSSDSSSDSSSSSSSSSSEDEADKPALPKSKKPTAKFKIPKLKNNSVWSSDEIENFRKIWPNLKNFNDSVLRKTSLKDLSVIGGPKSQSCKVLSQAMTTTFENLKNFPEEIQAGSDDCTGKSTNPDSSEDLWATPKTCGCKPGNRGNQMG